jgi:hypothetical protein
MVFLISFETAYEWEMRDGEYGRVRSAFGQVPEGSRIATVTLDQGEITTLSVSPHAGAWSVIDSSAFLSNFYIWPFQPFWVAYREPYAALAELARTDDPAAAPPAYETLKDLYDYVLVFGGDGAARLMREPVSMSQALTDVSISPSVARNSFFNDAIRWSSLMPEKAIGLSATVPS